MTASVPTTTGWVWKPISAVVAMVVAMVVIVIVVMFVVMLVDLFEIVGMPMVVGINIQSR